MPGGGLPSLQFDRRWMLRLSSSTSLATLSPRHLRMGPSVRLSFLNGKCAIRHGAIAPVGGIVKHKKDLEVGIRKISELLTNNDIRPERKQRIEKAHASLKALRRNGGMKRSEVEKHVREIVDNLVAGLID